MAKNLEKNKILDKKAEMPRFLAKRQDLGKKAEEWSHWSHDARVSVNGQNPAYTTVTFAPISLCVNLARLRTSRQVTLL